MAEVSSNNTTTSVTYGNITFNIPNDRLHYKGQLKNFIVYVSDKENPDHLQKLNSSFTLDEAKKIIQYELDDPGDNVFDSGYVDQFVFKVKDTRENVMYQYNPKTKNLETHL